MAIDAPPVKLFALRATADDILIREVFAFEVDGTFVIQGTRIEIGPRQLERLPVDGVVYARTPEAGIMVLTDLLLTRLHDAHSEATALASVLSIAIRKGRELGINAPPEAQAGQDGESRFW